MWKPTSIVDLFHHFFPMETMGFQHLYTCLPSTHGVFLAPLTWLAIAQRPGRWYPQILRENHWWMVNESYNWHMFQQSSNVIYMNDIWLPDITSNLIWVALINMISSSLSWFYLILVQKWQQYGINHCTGHHYPIDPRGFAVPKSWISDDTVFWSVYPA